MSKEILIYLGFFGLISFFFYFSSYSIRGKYVTFDKLSSLPIGCKIIYLIGICTIILNTLIDKSGGLTIVIWGPLLWSFHNRNITTSVKISKLILYFCIVAFAIAIIGFSLYQKLIPYLFIIGIFTIIFFHSIYKYLRAIEVSTNGQSIEPSESLYAEVFAELNGEKRKDGVWAIALSQNNGDENKAKADYINKRISQLSINLKTDSVTSKTKNNYSSFVAIVYIFISIFLVYIFMDFLTGGINLNLLKINLPDAFNLSKKGFTFSNCTMCNDVGCEVRPYVTSLEVDAESKSFNINYIDINGELKSKQRGAVVNENCEFSQQNKFSFICTNINSSTIMGNPDITRTSISFDGERFVSESYYLRNSKYEQMTYKFTCRMQ